MPKVSVLCHYTRVFRAVILFLNSQGEQSWHVASGKGSTENYMTESRTSQFSLLQRAVTNKLH